MDKCVNMRFGPSGMTDDPDIRMAQSIVDYIFRRLALDYLDYDSREALGIFTAEERAAEVAATYGGSQLEIDVEGARQVLTRRPDAVTIFLSPGTMEELERRLRGRGTETEENIQSRLSRARHEMDRAADYQHIIVNETVDQTVADIVAVLNKEQQGDG